MKPEQIRVGGVPELHEWLGVLSAEGAPRSLLLTDERVMEECFPLIVEALPHTELMVIPEGEEAKSPEVAQQLWLALLEQGFTRHDVLVTLGGGVVSDLGGWVASTYKRGMRLWHIPTTIIGMVDATIGGKSALNLGEVKNAVGTFYPAEEVLLVPELAHSLPTEQLLSGWGEVLKYALLGMVPRAEVCALDPLSPHFTLPTSLIEQCAKAKQELAWQDLHDTGKRQLLNLGHTFGHALELHLAHSTPLPHGVAVAAGLVCELYLSYQLMGYPEGELTKVAHYVKHTFPIIPLSCNSYEALFRLAQQDKKNQSPERVVCVLLNAEGKATPYRKEGGIGYQEWFQALDFYREYMGV